MIKKLSFPFSRKLITAVILIASLLALALPISDAKATTIVNFPDPNLEAAVRDAIGMPTGDIYDTDLLGLTFLYAGYMDIADVTGLEYCTNLTNLYLDNNQINDITPLSPLTSLNILQLNDNQISNIEPLSGLTSLSYLHLEGNQLSDISPLSGLTNLNWLSLNDTQTSDIEPLVNNPGISAGDNIDLDFNPLSYASLYNYIPQLEARGVMVYFNTIIVNFQDPNLEAAIRNAIGMPTGDIYPEDIEGLTFLDAGGMGIVDLTGLEFCTGLTDLYLYNNQISDIEPLVINPGISAGDTVGLDFNPLSYTSLYDYIPQLEARGVMVYFSPFIVTFPDPNLEAAIRDAIGKPTGDIYPEDLAGLTFLNAGSRGIADITGLECCTGLTDLLLYDNQISDIEPLVNNPGISAGDLVDLSDNPLSDTSLYDYIPQLEARGVSVYFNTIIVTFPDPNLEAAIRDAIGKPTGDIYPEDLAGLTFLQARNVGIVDLTGLEYCTNLTDLYLGENQISYITSLSGLTSLRNLHLTFNQISDITPLSGLTGLEELLIEANPINDFTSLSGLTSLERLYLSQNQIGDITWLSSLTSLTVLFLQNTQISDISPLSGLTNLGHLNINDNQISDLSPLSGLTSLTNLALSNTQISDFSPLCNLTSLNWLYLNNNQISNLSPLSGLNSLYYLNIADNQISDLSPLSGLTNLGYLHAEGNQISDLSPLSGLTNLSILHIDDNQINDLSPLSGLTSLMYLYLSYNQINDIEPLINNGGISWGDRVDLQENPLSYTALYECIPQLEARHVNVLYSIPANQFPDQPSNVSPSDAATFITTTPTLVASAFSDPNAGDTHAASEWQLTVSPGDYSSPVFESGYDAVNLTSIAVSPALDFLTTYYWHVRYQDNNGNWSNWSAETSFTTTNQPPDQPSNVSPADAATFITTTPTLIASAFSDPDAGDTHAASEWQLTVSAGDYSSPVFESGYDAANLTSITVSPALDFLTTYYWHVRYQDNNGNWSNWSAETSFTTIDDNPSSTPAGSDVTVYVDGAVVNFDTVTSGGTTAMTTSPSQPAELTSSSFKIRGCFFEVTTTATYSGTITVGIDYSEITSKPKNLKLLHWNEVTQAWDDVTTMLDTDNGIIYGEVMSIS